MSGFKADELFYELFYEPQFAFLQRWGPSFHNFSPSARTWADTQAWSEICAGIKSLELNFGDICTLEEPSEGWKRETVTGPGRYAALNRGIKYTWDQVEASLWKAWDAYVESGGYRYSEDVSSLLKTSKGDRRQFGLKVAVRAFMRPDEDWLVSHTRYPEQCWETNMCAGRHT